MSKEFKQKLNKNKKRKGLDLKVDIAHSFFDDINAPHVYCVKVFINDNLVCSKVFNSLDDTEIVISMVSFIIENYSAACLEKGLIKHYELCSPFTRD